MMFAEALGMAMLESALPEKNGRPSFQVRGTDAGQWEIGAPDIRAISRWDWVANAALASKNGWKNLCVDNATEHNDGFLRAMREAVKKYPDLASYVVSFDGPFKPLKDLLQQKPQQNWKAIVFYHGTATANWPSIEKQGLRPRGTGVPVYGAGVGAKAGRGDAVYLTTQRNMASIAARDAARVTKSEPLILRIQGLDDGDKMLPDEDSREKDPWSSLVRMGSVAYRGTIPAKLIKKE